MALWRDHPAVVFHVNPACVQALMFEESRMGITMLTFGSLLAPLRRLTGRILHAPSGGHITKPAQPPASCLTAARPRPAKPAPSGSSRERPCRPLRVVRVLEASRAPAGAGRMFMSGRMADVCAELDRLAALEGMQQGASSLSLSHALAPTR
jgi:hypothetical protein